MREEFAEITLPCIIPAPVVVMIFAASSILVGFGMAVRHIGYRHTDYQQHGKQGKYLSKQSDNTYAPNHNFEPKLDDGHLACRWYCDMVLISVHSFK